MCIGVNLKTGKKCEQKQFRGKKIVDFKEDFVRWLKKTVPIYQKEQLWLRASLGPVIKPGQTL